MAPLTSLSSLLLLATTTTPVLAADVVWSTFAFIHHGERTPLVSPNGAALTPQGAETMLDLGSRFRNRYLQNTSIHHVEGIERDNLDNTQLNVETAGNAWSAGSAVAFMQGLYPPAANGSIVGNNGGTEAGVGEGGTVTDFPLGGYQYPDIRARDVQDPRSIFVDGATACNMHESASADFDQAQENAKEIEDELVRIYETKFPDIDEIPHGMVQSWYVFELWDYARYEAARDETLAAELGEDLAILKGFAVDRELGLVGIGRKDEEIGGNENEEQILYKEQMKTAMPVAGRGILAGMVDRFEQYYSSGGWTQKLNLAFGSHEPILGWAALTGLAGGAPFNTIPEFGTALVFELYTPASKVDTKDGTPLAEGGVPMQSLQEDLRVRAYWAEGVEDVSWEEVEVLNGEGLEVNWLDFKELVVGKTATGEVEATMGIGFDGVEGWCDMCHNKWAFCGEFFLDDSFDEGLRASNTWWMSPGVAGALGAVCTLVFLLLAGGLAMGLGRVRVYRAGKGMPGPRGFMGDGGAAEDKDIAVGRDGDRAAKVGSWELRQGGYSGLRKDGLRVVVPAEPSGASTRTRVGGGGDLGRKWRRRDREEDEISVLGAEVQPRDHI